MSDAISENPGKSYYIIGGIFLLWNLLGLLGYYMSATMTQEALAEMYNPEQIAFVNAEPAWANAAYFAAVAVGVLACIMLLMRKSIAKTLFVVSFVAVLLQDLDSFVLRNGIGLFSTAELMLPVIVFVICLVEIWYSRSIANRYYR